MKHATLFLLTVLCAIHFTAQTRQAPEVPSPIIYIYDASGSMWGQMQGKTKMEIAASVLSKSINDYAENQQISLVAYGHREKGDCRDVETLIPISNTSKSKVANAVNAIKPLGKTPLAFAAETVIDQLRTSKQKATIVLITDGIESCDGNICDVVKASKAEGIDFKLHIVGFGLKKGETEQLVCAAKEGDGNYYDAADASKLGDAMSEVATQTIDREEGNFGVYAVKNNEPIDAWVRAYKAGTDEQVNTLRTYGETRYMYLPAGIYDLEVNPLASDVKAIKVTNVESFDHKKTEKTVSFDGGIIAVTTTNNDEGWDTMVKVLGQDGKQVASKRTYGSSKELEVNPGTYTVTFQALVMKGTETFHESTPIVVEAGKTVSVAHNFATGKVALYATVGDDQIDTIVNFKDSATGKNIDSKRTYTKGAQFLLNPGTYTVKVQPLGIHKGKSAQTLTMTVNKGETISKTLRF